MKIVLKTKRVKRFLYCTVFIWTVSLLYAACTKEQPMSSGSAIITGKLVDVPNEQNENSIIIKLIVPNLILEKAVEYEIQLGKDGTFKTDVPLLNASYVSLLVEETPTAIFYLAPGQKITAEISFTDNKIPQIKTINGEQLTVKEMQQIGELYQKILTAIQENENSPILEVTISPEVYRDSMTIKMEKDLSILKNDSQIPGKLKQIVYNDLKFFYLFYDLFNYEKNMQLLYLNRNQNFTPPKPSKQYYSFLKNFNLNQPPYYNYLYYSLVLEGILNNNTLSIPSIVDRPVTDWQKDVKAILTDLTGLDSGLFYDLLTAKAYYLQIKNKLQPLSAKQKENIQNYFQNPFYTDILFLENESLIAELSEKLPLSINETPAVPKEKLMDSILSKYKGTIAVVDFWATWCQPCLEAMKESKSLKFEMKDKKVTFVYITNPSSPVNIWETRIYTIGGEHYYLNKEDWESLSFSDKYRFDGIPTYLIFDTNGKLRHKITAYPGNDAMRKMITELLN
jgi:thiol-disulfide isomerase/thioredoxin